MAKTPNSATPSRVAAIMANLRGNFNFTKPEDQPAPVSFGGPELLSNRRRSKILSKALNTSDTVNAVRHNSTASVFSLVQSSLTNVGKSRLENRRILEVMPEVDKAARLMVASIFSPNDLSRNEIPITITHPGIPDALTTRLQDAATEFFQRKLDLKTNAPSWVYQFGYESGSVVYAIVPLRSFEKIENDAFIGSEGFVTKVLDPLSHDDVFGFGDTARNTNSVLGLESLVGKELDSLGSTTGIMSKDDAVSLAKKMIATESLVLSDNPNVLQAATIGEAQRNRQVRRKLDEKYRNPKTQQLLSVSAERTTEGDDKILGNPIQMRLPPESVTVIHTPGNPNDHQGYLVLLDQLGNPIDLAAQEDSVSLLDQARNNQGNIFAAAYNAYGMGMNDRTSANLQAQEQVYSKVVLTHLKQRLNKAGITQAKISNTDSIFRCMFARFMQQMQTRVLFLPRELVTYMTFEKDQYGYGVSRLNGIRFSLSMKMTLQVSKVLAAIKAAMDKRRIEVNFTDNNFENPEAIFQSIINQYANKQALSFSTDPNVVQSQIVDKSISIKAQGIPGLEGFEINNEQDTRAGNLEGDQSLMEYVDKQITNGLRVPASTMNSLNEDEYARSVVTTNLFFAMDVSIDQDVVIKDISDLVRKYARYSEEFHNEIYKILPSLNPEDKAHGDQRLSESGVIVGSDTAGNKEEYTVPKDLSVDTIIDSMMISLPKPNIAPQKAQFEALDAMTQSITNLFNSLLPDDLAGGNDSLRPVIAMLRAKFISNNIRGYLDMSGMGNVDTPTTDYAGELRDLDTMLGALENLAAMLKDKQGLAKPKDPAGDGTDPTAMTY